MSWDSMYESVNLPSIGSSASTRMTQALGGTRLTFVGANELIRTLSHDIPEATRKGIVEVTERAAHIVLLRAQELVPIDTGLLHSTGRVVSAGLTSSSAISQSSYRVAVEYGGDEIPYTVLVHEDLTKLHGAAYNFMYGGGGGKRHYDNRKRAAVAKNPFHPRRPQEQAKFLEQAFIDTQDAVRMAFANGLSRVIMRILKNPKRYGYSGAHDPALGGFSELRKEYDYGRY